MDPTCYRRLWLGLVWLVVTATATAGGAESALPWEKDFSAAVTKARAEKRPVFLMLTATWCGPCKMLESQTLPAPEIRAGLKEFVWVKAYEDKELDRRFEAGGYPTLVFLDASGEKVLFRTVGYEPPGPFLRQVLQARLAADLPLTQEMRDLQAKSFVPEEARVQIFLRNGDAEGLVSYLAPAAKDVLRENNYLVAKVRIPPGVRADEVQASIVSGPELPFPQSGLMMTPVPREVTEASLRVLAPGCVVLEEPLRLEATNAVTLKEFEVRRLTERNSASFQGKVLKADGQIVSNAIVRLCDWGWTRVGGDGRFSMNRVSPGTFTVRAEAPGGELQEDITFESGKPLERDLVLKPVTTVGIRWALQTKEGSRELVGDGVRSGEAFFSVDHSRFLLSRGAEVPQAYGSDFMMQSTWKDLSPYIEKETLAELERSNGGAPIFWLFDVGPHSNGLHAETLRFEDLQTVNDGKPYDEKSYFKFLRGETVRKGRVYTLRCTRRDCYAKLEITDVTLVPDPAPNK